MKDDREKTAFGRINPAILCSVLAVALGIALCLALCLAYTNKPQDKSPANQDLTGVVSNEANPEKEEITLSVTHQGEQMLVQTQFCRLTYPGAFVDVMEVNAVNEENGRALVFAANIQGRTYPLYALHFDAEAGQPVGSLVNASGQRVSVSVEFFALPEALAEGEKNTFLAAQETANDVLTSLEENDNYLEN